MNASPPLPDDVADAFLRLYDRGLPEVYGYLLGRTGDVALAEDLAAETFLAAARHVKERPATELSVGWLVTVGRNKLVDHWRRSAAEQRRLQLVSSEPDPDTDDETWLEEIGATRAHQVMTSLAPQHRLALTLRYVDDLPVPEVAAVLDRTLHATEALLVRARRAFRTAYEEGGDDER